ncbi:PilZ domain-containing protein [Allosphingosinicella vermicomposti]|uniref:PilZ domain-containing protein n=1 Tax=Allosphingosinicella vermicomposti TaxID=614671 RepID=UPI000D0FB95E|nr:PilZ domain-containing protein [Allosphingosinicella vermicomposti]
MLALHHDQFEGAPQAAIGLTPADQRSESRRDGVDGAMLTFRGHRIPAQVLNISSRGTMIECPIAPRLGETIIVQFDRCTPVHAFVRWVKEGQLGLRFGHEIILA